MTDLEQLYLKSLHTSLNSKEQLTLDEGLRSNPTLHDDLKQYDRINQLLRSRKGNTFGPYFVARLMHRIQNTGLVIDREIFSFFRKFQLAAFGIIIALLAFNIFVSQGNLLSAFGLDTSTPASGDATEIISFDYSEILNENL